MSDSKDRTASSRHRSGWLTVVPMLVFAALAAMFLYALRTGDPARMPSALIGKPVPAFDLAPLTGVVNSAGPVPGLSSTDLTRGKPVIVNVWASWCVPCRDEQPILVRLAQQTAVPIVGINYKDAPADARAFLERYGNPFERIGVDPSGRTGIEWGVFGVPETYVVDARGRISYRHVGPLTPASITADLLPAIQRAGG